MAIKTTQEIQSEIQTQHKNAFGNDINVETSGVIGQIIGISAGSYEDLYQLADAVASQFDLSKAIGNQLDILAKLSDSVRGVSTASKISGVTLSGTNGVFIPAGSIIKYKNNIPNGDTFTLDSSVTIGVSGTVLANFSNTTTGSISIDTGAIFQIVTQVNGWNGIDATAGTVTIGNNFQNDDSFRNKLSLLPAKNATNLVDSLSGDLYDYEAISKAVVYEYRTRTKTPKFTVDFTLTDLGYFEAIVVISSSDTLQNIYDNIASIIYKNKPTGVIPQSEAVKYNDVTSVSGNTKDSLGNTISVNFSLAKEDSFNAKISISALPNETFEQETVISGIKSYLFDYIEGLPIGGKAYWSKALCLMAQSGSGFVIETFTWGDLNNTNVKTDIQIDPSYYGTIQDSNIDITVV